MEHNELFQTEGNIVLRDVRESDLALFFEQQLDPEANHMAAFTAKDPTDRDAFMKHWHKILADETTYNQTILAHGQVAGHIASYKSDAFDGPEVTYWIGKSYWGQGIATRALSLFLKLQKVRPIYGRAAKDNPGSLRVLAKCGFNPIGEDRGFANARNEEIEELLLKLD
ncbi:GNAT family N-acetyltransferase [Ktedonospora formicarum]|uniref:N-acetyltransferase n=1 Tax=Ktedonospora formicarum TaxID=2778364 RepID=A0A8J3HVN0_9CHLR|nr:GNAT family N-acetyltransferase [Ktedonospora formicarum]GHO44609.1 N-acetyltransferase [Ktedonospora formicarum]